MKLIVCVDVNNGMLFNKRRLSKDRAVREDILRISQGVRLWMNGYSYRQFAKMDCFSIMTDEDFLIKADSDAYCFAENIEVKAYIAAVSELIVYRWDRMYPADVFFPAEILSERAVLLSTTEFQGYSHDVITREVYAL